jgi:hypothetical protein
MQADQRADKMKVFRDLMGHRYDVTHANYVAALNLIQIEFSNSEPIMKALAEYLKAFHQDTTPKPDCGEIRRKAIIRLLTAIGDDLGYKLEQLDLMEQVYSPQGWANLADQQKSIRDLFSDIASGKRGLPVFTMMPPALLEDIGNGRFAITTVQKNIKLKTEV